MTDYTLAIAISASDLPALRDAGERIVLCRPLPDAGNLVAWAVLALAQSQTVSWNDSYALFASATPNELGRVISVQASVSATARCSYTYDGVFSAPTPDSRLAADQYLARNLVPATQAPSLLLGLAQAFACDGALPAAPTPLNAQSIPANQYALMTQSGDLLIYLASDVKTSTILELPFARRVISPALSLRYSATSTAYSIVYSAVVGGFVLSS